MPAGERRTTSPGSARVAAAATASSSVGDAPQSATAAIRQGARRSSSPASPKQTTARQRLRAESRQTVEWQVLVAAAEEQDDRLGEGAQAGDRPLGLVAMLSFTQVAPAARPTTSRRWGTPRKARAARAIASTGSPAAAAMAQAMTTFARLCSPRSRTSPTGSTARDAAAAPDDDFAGIDPGAVARRSRRAIDVRTRRPRAAAISARLVWSSALRTAMSARCW